MLFRKIYFSPRTCFLKLHVIRKKCELYVVNWIKTRFFVCNIFFKICSIKFIFSSKSCLLENFFSSKSSFLKKYFFLKNWRVVKFLIQNLTRCKKLDSRSGKMKNFYFKIMLFAKFFSFRIMLSRKNFTFKIMLFRNFFFFKILHFEIARNTQKMRILRGKLNQNVIFCAQHFFQNLLLKLIFFFKIVLLRKNFFFKVMLSESMYFFEKVTRREDINSKSDAL